MGQAQAVRFHWSHPNGHRLRRHVAAAQRGWGDVQFHLLPQLVAGFLFGPHHFQCPLRSDGV